MSAFRNACVDQLGDMRMRQSTEDGALSTLSALANASDPDNGTTLVVTDVPATLPAGVSYDVASGAFTLDPSNVAFQHLAQGQSTTVSVNYSVSDGIVATAAAVSWTVTHCTG